MRMNISDRVEKQVARRLGDSALARRPEDRHRVPTRRDCLLIVGAKEWALLRAYALKHSGLELPGAPFTPEGGRIAFRELAVFLVDDPDFLEVIVS